MQIRNKTINILFVFHNANIQSGATKCLIDIIDYLISTESYNITACFPEVSGSAITYLTDSKGINVYNYKYGGLMQDLNQPLIIRILKLPLLYLRFIALKQQAHKASQELASEHIQVVYSNTSIIVFGGYLGYYLKSKQVWHIHEFRKKDHRITFFLGERYLKKFINKCADAVLFVSKSTMLENVDLIDRSKITVTYNSFSPELIQAKYQFQYGSCLNLLIAGDIKPGKGQKDTVVAVNNIIKKYPQCHLMLHLAGSKSNVKYYESIEKYIQNNYIEKNVIMHGQVSDMLGLRANMDVGIIASENEAFGRTTIEGMLSMMAMIGRNSGGTAELIRHKDTGLLYDGSISDLEKKILYLYKNRTEMERMARNSFQECIEKYTKGRYAKIVENTINQIL